MNLNMQQMPCFGVAGNFTGHLEQAGEAKDFTLIKTLEPKAPKALFPTYIPNGGKSIPAFLNVFPFSSDTIIFPKGEQKLQIEPECAVVFDVMWKDGFVSSLIPVCFGASNDCSIRKEGSRKISEKKNWGECTKGFSGHPIMLNDFSKQGILDSYRIASFLVRNGKAEPYGEDSAVREYSYIYEKLIAWLIDKLNYQKDEGPAENIHAYLSECGFPKKILISIGATRYTDYGEHNFLQDKDIAAVILYPETVYTPEQIRHKVESQDLGEDDISVLWQKVVL
ncbi:MAG: DUF5718 family protein [Treponema sp.]|nr:DUF5718 family protein [Treponema sp.]